MQSRKKHFVSACAHPWFVNKCQPAVMKMLQFYEIARPIYGLNLKFRFKNSAKYPILQRFFAFHGRGG
jgi:hypothetical protein